VEVDLLDGGDLAFLDESAQLGDRQPLLVSVLSTTATWSTTAAWSTPAATATASTSTASTAARSTTSAAAATKSSAISHFSSLVSYLRKIKTSTIVNYFGPKIKETLMLCGS
jgi:hypothetical protein